MKGELKPLGKDKRSGEERYLIRIFLGRDAAGRRSWHCETYKGKKRDAENRLNDVLAKYNRGELRKPSRLPLAEYLDSWLADVLEGTEAPRTFQDYKEHIGRYIKPELGDLRLCDLDAFQVQALYAKMRRKGLSPRTIRYSHNVLARALENALKLKLITVNVARLAELPKSEDREMRAMSGDQAARFLESACSDRFFAMWMLALDSGMRPEEYLALTWGDVDFDAARVSVRRVLCYNRKGGGWYFTEPKSKRSKRSIILSRSTVEALRAHKAEQNYEVLAMGESYKRFDLVFAAHGGGPLSRPNLQNRHFKPILRRAKLPEDFRIYDLRHTCATLLLEANVHPKIVQERLGHSTIRLTMDTYTHVLPSMQEVASLALESTVFAQVKKVITISDYSEN